MEILKEGGVIIYPTDTVYAIGCDIMNKKAAERLCRIRGIEPGKALFSCVCESVSIIGEYAVGVSTPVYKLLKRALPGPYTFILKASKKVPRHFQTRRKTIGIRVVDHPVTTAIVKALGNPLLTTSLKDSEDPLEYKTDPELIHEKYGKIVDAVIDGGPGGIIPSTVIDVSQGEDNIVVLREGAGDLEKLNLVLKPEEI